MQGRTKDPIDPKGSERERIEGTTREQGKKGTYEKRENTTCCGVKVRSCQLLENNDNWSVRRKALTEVYDAEQCVATLHDTLE